MNYQKNRNEIVEEMKIEYGYIFCENCHTSNAYKFHCHHIIFRSEKPNHPNIHDKRNLIIVCHTCHDNFHGNKDVRNELVKNRKLKELFQNNVK